MRSLSGLSATQSGTRWQSYFSFFQYHNAMKNLRVGVEAILSGLASGQLSVDAALRKSMEYINILGLYCSDIYESLDLLVGAAGLSNPAYDEETSSLIFQIPESTTKKKINSSIAETTAEIVRIACNKKSTIHSASPLKFCKSERVTVFYDPLMIGFASEESLSTLGWGSAKAASHIAQSLVQTADGIDLCAGRIAIILTRHPSKYAHFVRDRLTKIIWCEYLSGMGPFDEYIFDYPLELREIECLRDLGITSRFLYAADLGRLFTVVGECIVVIEVTSGMSLLPSLSQFISDKYPTSGNTEKIFLRRGHLGRRRKATNDNEVEELFMHLGYKAVDISSISYIKQLTFCQDSLVTAGMHGAQLVNAHNSSSLIELHTFPYAASPWAESMLKMAGVLQIPYVPLLLSSIEHANDLVNYEEVPLRYLQNQLVGNSDNPSSGQSSRNLIDIKNLRRSVELAESLIEKINIDIA